MSSTGPAPGAKKNAGFGCQASTERAANAANAATGRPMRPSSTACRACWIGADRNVSGAQPTRRPRRSASSSSAAPSASVVASGFSEYTCLRALRIPCETAACAVGGVRLTTISTVPSSRTSTGEATRAMPNSSARARA